MAVDISIPDNQHGIALFYNLQISFQWSPFVVSCVIWTDYLAGNIKLNRTHFRLFVNSSGTTGNNRRDLPSTEKSIKFLDLTAEKCCKIKGYITSTSCNAKFHKETPWLCVVLFFTIYRISLSIFETRSNGKKRTASTHYISEARQNP